VRSLNLHLLRRIPPGSRLRSNDNRFEVTDAASITEALT